MNLSSDWLNVIYVFWIPRVRYNLNQNIQLFHIFNEEIMARRTIFISYIASYLLAISMIARTIIRFYSTPEIITISLLCGSYIVLLIIEPIFIHQRQILSGFYLLAQTVIICLLAIIISDVDFWAVMFCPLIVQVMFRLAIRTGYLITGILTVIMSYFMLTGLGSEVGMPLIFVYGSIYFLLAAFINIIQDLVKARQESEEQRADLQLAHQQLQLYTEQAEELAVLKERGRLARELHDSVTQSLHSSTLMAEAGQRLAREGDLERARGYLIRLGEISQQALREMRLLVYELRPTILREVGLAGALQQRLDAVESRSGVEVDLNLDEDIDIPQDITEELFWISLEALNNALKHATPSRVTVSLYIEDPTEKPCYGVVITDDGKGFDPDLIDAGGLGLVTMKERIEKLGGTLEIRSTPGEGTRVKACVHQEDHI